MTKAIRLTDSQRSAVEIYVVDPAILQAAEDIDDQRVPFDLRGSVLHVLADDDVACAFLIDAANSADEDGVRAGGRALMNLCRTIRSAQ